MTDPTDATDAAGTVAGIPFGEDLRLETAQEARDLGRRLAGALRAGDLLILTGELGAGKTTFTQGLAEGLGVRGPITSPTFVIARVHPSLVGGPVLVHADAYRLSGELDLEALDLDADLDRAVTVVEWGKGLAEALSEDHLEVVLTRAVGGAAPSPAGRGEDDKDSGPADDSERTEDLDDSEDAEAADPRTVRLVGHGDRWA